MIFKTIQNDATGATKSISIFNSTIGTMKRNLASGQGISYSIFNGNKLTQNDVSAIQDYAKALRSGIGTGKSWRNTMGGCSVAAKQYILNSRKAGKSTDEMVAGLKEVPKVTNAASIGLNALSVAGNMLLSIGISMAISGIIKGFQAIANAQENAIEKANEFISKFEEQRDKLTSNKQTIDSISSDYEKLAKGVDSLGRNVSLNSDEYARYNEIVNQIADMFPQMVQGYTDEGNAIIAHKGNVEELTKAYEEQKKAAQDAIIVGSADVFKGFKAKVDNVKDFFGEEYGLIQKKEQLELAKEILNYGQYDGNDEEFNKLMSRFANSGLSKTVLKEAGIDEWSSSFTNIFDILMENKTKILSYLRTISTDIEAETAKIKPIMQAYLEQSFEFQGLDEKAQDVVKKIVGNFDSEFYSQFDNETEMAAWVTENIVNKFKGKDGEKMAIEFGAMFDLQTKFNNGDITVAEYQEKLSAFLTLIGSLPEETQKSIKLLFGITTNDDGTTSSDVETMIANVKKKFKGKFEKEIGQLTLDELKILADLDISPKGIKSWEEVETLIANAAKEANKIDVSLDSYKKASEGISSLATAFKELTDDEYVSLETISKIKEAVGDSISNWDEYEQKLLSVKKGTAEYNQLMSELTYATLEKQLGGVNALAQADEKYVAQLLKENGVLNANVVSEEMVKRAKAKVAIQSKENIEVSDDNVDALLKEANSSGITANAYLELVAEEILFNNNGISTEDKCEQILNIASVAGVATASIETLNSELEEVLGAKVGSGKRTSYAKEIGLGVIAEKDRGEEGKGKGNLYTYNGQEFEDLDDATYYKNAHDALQNIKNSYKPIELDYSGNKSSSKDPKEDFDWIETKVKRLQRTITNLGKTVSSTWESWTNRNSALKSQISAVTSEITLQQQAADKYWKLAESVTGVGNYKGLIQKGALDISTVKDEKTIDAIKQYEEYYEKYLSALDAKQDAQDELASLVREDFDMIAKQFDSEISLVEANISTLEAYIDQTEMKGNLVSKNYYSAMYEQEEKNLSYLQQKYDQLSNKLSNGIIKQGSEEWNSMSVEIKEVKQAIIESTTALEEYQKTMRELDWEVFELIQDKIGNVTDESEFFIDLLSNSKLFNDDGSITSQGQATLGLHAVNYQTYIDSAEEYGNEIAKIDEKLASDPNNQHLLDKKQEYIELQRESILAAEDEKQAIVDLVDNGYDVFLDYLDESINKYKELLSSAKDLRDYEKQVSEQTEEIARLQNIINSYNGDTSEEAKTAIQKYTVELKDAQEALEETEYEKYISDQEQMLDAMRDDAEQFFSERLDDTDALISGVIDSINGDSNSIKKTLEDEADAVGYNISESMKNIWDGIDDENGNGGIKGVLGAVSETLNSIKEDVHSMVKDSDTEASKNASNATVNVTPTTKPATTPPSTSNTNNNSSTSAKTITVGGKINAGSAKIYDYAGSNNGQRQYYRNDPIYTVLAEKNGYLKVRHHKLSSGTTGWFKKSDVKAYKTGGKVDYTGLAMVHGSKSKPELMLNAKDTENFIALKDALSVVAKTNMFDAIGNYAKLPNFVPNGSTQNTSGDVIFENIEIVANDPQEFARQLKDVYDRNVGNVRKMINTDVHSKYGSHNYRRYL